MTDWRREKDCWSVASVRDCETFGDIIEHSEEAGMPSRAPHQVAKLMRALRATSPQL